MCKRITHASICLARFLFIAWVIAVAMVGHAQQTELEPSMKASAVQITWDFAAPPESVWAAWTTSDAVQQWFGSDPEGKVLKAEMDVRPGGQFEVTFADSDGTLHTARGVYKQLEPYRRLEFSWGWQSEPGVETLIKIRLTPNGKGTKMDFEHGNLVQVSSHDYQSGWRSTFQKIDKLLANMAAKNGALE